MEEKKVQDETVEVLGELVVEDEDGKEVTLYIVDQTKISGVDYILATDTQEDGGNGFIFKVEPEEGSEFDLLTPVSDEEYDYIAKVFAETADVEFEA